EQGSTIDNIALSTRRGDADTTIEFVDGEGVTADVTDFVMVAVNEFEEERPTYILSITAAEDAPLGDRSILLTNADGEGIPRYGMIEVVAPGTLGGSAE
ncbi:MAG: hypothetical protein AAF639_42180, partial [Chloroflexota bacterium]